MPSQRISPLFFLPFSTFIGFFCKSLKIGYSKTERCCECMEDSLPTWKVKNAYMNKGKWRSVNIPTPWSIWEKGGVFFCYKQNMPKCSIYSRALMVSGTHTIPIRASHYWVSLKIPLIYCAIESSPLFGVSSYHDGQIESENNTWRWRGAAFSGMSCRCLSFNELVQ